MSPLASLLMAILLSFISSNYLLNINIELKIYLIISDILIIFLTYSLIKLIDIDAIVLHTYLLQNELYAGQYRWLYNKLFKVDINNYTISIDKNKLITYLNNDCAICLNSKNEKITILKCNHIYCQECIEQWLKEYNNCPTCKTKLQ